MRKHPVRKFIGLTLLYAALIVGIFVIQFKAESVISETIAGMRVTLAETETSTGAQELKNTLQLAYKGLTFYANEDTPAYLTAPNGVTTDLTLSSWRNENQPSWGSVRFEFTDGSAIEFSTKEEFLLSILEEMKLVNESSEKFNSRFVISLNAISDNSEYEDILKIYNGIQNQELKKLIVGIDYSGDVTSSNCMEKKYTDIIEIFEKFRTLGLGVCLHLGQNPNYQRFPLNLFVPDRVSHCIFLNDEDINNLIKKNIHLEICPSYNFKVNKCIYYEEIILKKLWNKKYVKEKQPLDKAGAYGIQEMPNGYVKNIEGSLENVIGLCTKTVLEMLNT